MLQGVNEACAPRNDTLSHLFSIYIHPSPTFKGYPKGSIFRGREISPRIKVEWGSWSIVEVRCTFACTYPKILPPVLQTICVWMRRGHAHPLALHQYMAMVVAGQ